jgi:alpha-tubulin suppressor-like RCC1 family protein
VSFRHLTRLLLISGPFVLTACASHTGAPRTTGVIGMALGAGHSCATLVDNGMRCWGFNQSGQLGDGRNADSATPVEPTSWGSGPTGVGGGATILDFAAGDSHTCANSSRGKLFCWGSNQFGQLGLDSTTDFNLSQPVREIISRGSPLQATSVVAGDNHTCALYSVGSVACWGRHYDMKPQRINGLTNPQRIAAGGNQTCVLEAGGAVNCWRQIVGNAAPTPAIVPGISAKKIAVGRLHACAIDQMDAVQCWGSNTQGQLGIGNRFPANGVVAVHRSGAVVAALDIAAGHEHTCALLASGAVECWGGNQGAQTGDPGQTGFTLTARPVITSGASGVAAGAAHTCARILDGNVARMHCWGMNDTGQLGSGSAGQFSVTPVRVPGLP